MEEHEIEIIKKAYKRCFGLYEAFNKFIDADKVVSNEIVATLSYQTGLRKEFIIEHKEEIKNLKH